MKKILLVLFFCFSGFHLEATETRINALGLESWMLEDDTNIWFNPARLKDHGNSSWLELGTPPVPDAGEQWGGIADKVGAKTAVGLFLNRPYSGQLGNLGSNSSGSDLTSVPTNIVSGVNNASIGNLGVLSPSNNKFDFFFNKTKENKGWGLLFTLANRAESQQRDYTSVPSLTNDGKVTNTRLSTDLNIKWGFQRNMFSELVFSLGVPVVWNTYTESRYVYGQANNSTDERKLASGPAFVTDCFWRRIKEFPAFTLVKMMDVGYSYWPSLYTEEKDLNGDGTLDTDLEQTRLMQLGNMRFGLAANRTFLNKILLVSALSLNYQRTVNNGKSVSNIQSATTEEYKWHRDEITVPVVFGLEYNLSQVVVPRIGVKKNLCQVQRTVSEDPDWNSNRVTSQEKTVSLNYPDSGINVSVGTGINLGSLIIDTVIAQNILFSGTYIISGQSGYPVSKITVSYKF